MQRRQFLQAATGPLLIASTREVTELDDRGQGGDRKELMLGRLLELRRRIDFLPAEATDWFGKEAKGLDENVHFSQLETLRQLVLVVFPLLWKGGLGDLERRAEQANNNDIIEFHKMIIRGYKYWHFVRDKLELRLAGRYQGPLWLADTIAWDCFGRVVSKARTDRPTPPLCYYWAGFSPQAYYRGQQVAALHDDLGDSFEALIPVIELPWDHAANPWESLAIPHEVGHILERDLGLAGPLTDAVASELRDPSVPAKRAETWARWRAETFADLVAVQFAGPAYVESLLHTLILLPDDVIKEFDPEKAPHPTHHLRIYFLCEHARNRFPFEKAQQHLREIEGLWRSIYGDLDANLKAYLGDLARIERALMGKKLEALGARTVADLLPEYTEATDTSIRLAARSLVEGRRVTVRVDPRHAAAAARIAVTAALSGVGDRGGSLEKIARRMEEAVRQYAPTEKRGPAGLNQPRKDQIERIGRELLRGRS